MDLPLDQLLELVKGQGFGGALNSVLLALILLNIRSLKFAILKIEDGHDKRLGALEIKQEKIEGRVAVLETQRG